MIKGIVIAGDYSEYTSFIRENKLCIFEYMYTCTPEHLLGLHKIPIIKTGEYWLNPVINSPQLKLLEMENKK